MTMHINRAGLEIIKSSESCRLKAYLDNQHGRVWTVGYGHTGPDVVEGLRILPEQAIRWLVEDCEEAERGVEKCVKVALNENQFSALVSFVFNIGEAQFKRSTMCRLINAGEFAQAARQFARWVYDEGVIQPGLITRREREKELFEQLAVGVCH